jgi:hypothetical protein
MNKFNVIIAIALGLSVTFESVVLAEGIDSLTYQAENLREARKQLLQINKEAGYFWPRGVYNPRIVVQKREAAIRALRTMPKEPALRLIKLITHTQKPNWPAKEINVLVNDAVEMMEDRIHRLDDQIKNSDWDSYGDGNASPGN